MIPNMHVLVISGPRASGKTSLCISVFHVAKTHNIICQGCIELSERGDGMQPYRIQLVDLTSGDTYLAAQRPKDRNDIPFDFYPESFAHIRENCIRSLDQTTQEIKIQTAQSKTFYIIDETGPLEHERNKGHLEFLKVVLDSALADALVLTMRADLQEILLSILKKHDIPTADIHLLEIDKQFSMDAQKAASFFIETI